MRKHPRIISLLSGCVELREPWPTEEKFFRSNPNVSGMAAEDGRVVLNPFSTLDNRQMKAVALNEAARIVMNRDGITPSFSLTTEQKEAFSGYGSIEDIKATVAARLLSEDPSAMTPTQEQVDFVQRLSTAMNEADILP